MSNKIELDNAAEDKNKKGQIEKTEKVLSSRPDISIRNNMLPGSYIKNKDGSLSPNLDDPVMQARLAKTKGGN